MADESIDYHDSKEQIDRCLNCPVPVELCFGSPKGCEKRRELYTKYPNGTPKIDSVALGDRIRVLRKGKHMTQVELANRLHTVCPLICRWEQGLQTPNDESVAKLAVELGVTERFIKYGI